MVLTKKPGLPDSLTPFLCGGFGGCLRRGSLGRRGVCPLLQRGWRHLGLASGPWRLGPGSAVSGGGGGGRALWCAFWRREVILVLGSAVSGRGRRATRSLVLGQVLGVSQTDGYHFLTGGRGRRRRSFRPFLA